MTSCAVGVEGAAQVRPGALVARTLPEINRTGDTVQKHRGLSMNRPVQGRNEVWIAPLNAAPVGAPHRPHPVQNPNARPFFGGFPFP